MHWQLFCFLLITGLVLANQENPIEKTQGNDIFLLRQIKGIVIFSDPSDKIDDVRKLSNLKGVQIGKLNIDVDKRALCKRLSCYLDQPLNDTRMLSIKVSIVEFFESKGYPLVYVSVPNQEITNGVLQLLVKDSLLGEIMIESKKKATCDVVKKYFKYEFGTSIYENDLLTDLSFINKNPFRRANLVYAEGKKINTTDIMIPVEERKIWRIYLGAENTGLITTGRQRWLAGFNWGRVFGLDHTFSYQFTQATEIKEFQAHTAQYIAFLPWEHLLTIYGGYSRVHANLPVKYIKNRGSSGQASLRYTYPLVSRPFFDHELNFGVDYKITNNNLDVSTDLETITGYVNLSQFVLGYALKYQKGSAKISFDSGIYFSPGRILPHQADQYFNDLRLGAENTWVYWKSAFNYSQKFKYDWGISLLIEGQWSNATLLPSEQFGLGGAFSVRGYDEREVNKDSAIFASGEIFSPYIKVLGNTSKKINDAIQFIYFLDYGWGGNHTPVPGEQKAQYLLGTGPGIRYTWDPCFSAKLDWGIRLHRDKEQFGDGKSRIHFSVVLSY